MLIKTFKFNVLIGKQREEEKDLKRRKFFLFGSKGDEFDNFNFIDVALMKLFCWICSDKSVCTIKVPEIKTFECHIVAAN